MPDKLGLSGIGWAPCGAQHFQCADSASIVAHCYYLLPMALAPLAPSASLGRGAGSGALRLPVFR